MAKKPANSKPAAKGQPSQPQQGARSQQPKAAPSSFMSRTLPYLIILLFCAGIYSNTLKNEYALDDPLIFTENKFAMKGFAGIKDLMTHDAFAGYFGEHSTESSIGGRYRPLSLVSFAMEVELFGLKPKISHGVNVLLFILTCLLLYHLLTYLLPQKKDSPPFYISIPFIATMLFAGHPIHTEAVANIKGRDEIMALLFSLLALFAALKYVRTQNILHLVWGAVVFLLALLSKENAITFIAVIPLTYYFFTKAQMKDYAMTVGLYIVPLIIFLGMRAAYTKSGLDAEATEILNNPFAYLPHNGDGMLQRFATVIMTFLLYIRLLIFPHPLTDDYYYNQVPYVGITNPLFLLSLIINVGLLVYAIMGWKKKALPSYAILFYFITFSIVSNLFFTVGAIMGERFLYMCSIGFCLLVAWLMVRARERFNLPAPAIAGVLVAILLLYSVKAISRNQVWKNNTTLFLTDAKTSSNSAKVQMTAGFELTALVDKNFDSLRRDGSLQEITDLLDMNVNVASLADTSLKRLLLERAMKYLDTSLKIYPTRATAWLQLGNTAYKLHNNLSEAVAYFDSAEVYGSGANYDAWYNMGTLQLNNNQPMQARESLLKAIVLKPDEFVCRFNLALAYFNLNRPDSALYWFSKALENRPQDALTNFAIGTIYGKQLNNPDMAIRYLSTAIQYNPNIPGYYYDLYTAYDKKNMEDDAIRVSQQCLQKYPNDATSIMNIANAYNKKGDPKTAQEYTARLMQQGGHK